MTLSWPPKVEDLKKDLGIESEDTRDDDQLSRVLGAAVSFVEAVRGESYNFKRDPLSDLPDPTADLKLGTLRLASRWHTRRRSPDGLIEMAEQGSARIPSFDPDIERLLGIGKFKGATFA